MTQCLLEASQTVKQTDSLQKINNCTSANMDIHPRRLYSSSSSLIRHNKVRNIKLMKHTVGKTYQAHRALTVAFN